MEGTKDSAPPSLAPTLEDVRLHARSELAHLVQKIAVGGEDEHVAMVFTRRDVLEVMGLFGNIADLRGIGFSAFYQLESGLDTTRGETCAVYMFHTDDVEAVQEFIKQRRAHELSGLDLKVKYHLVFFPARSAACERELESEGLFGLVDIHVLPLWLLPLDVDLATIDVSSCFRRLYLDEDIGPEWDVAKGIALLERLYGRIPVIVGKGERARSVCGIIDEQRKKQDAASQRTSSSRFVSTESLHSSTPMRHSTGSSSSSAAGDMGMRSRIEKLVILDRTTDVVTPLLTQFTYEGLLDEILGVRLRSLKVEKGIVVGEKEHDAHKIKMQFVPIALTGEDALFRSIRDINFSILCPALKQKAKKIDETYKEGDQADSISQLRRFMAAVSEMQREHRDLRIHVHLVEKLLQTVNTELFMETQEMEQTLLAQSDVEVERVMAMVDRSKNSAERVLCLLCIMSHSHGLCTAEVKSAEQRFLKEYGWVHVLTFTRLKDAGLLRVCGTADEVSELRRQYKRNMRKFDLIVPETSYNEPTDISYAYNDYAPLLVRIASLFITDAWKQKLSNIKQVPGVEFEFRDDEAVLEEHSFFRAFRFSMRKEDRGEKEEEEQHQHATAVVVIGGITRAEISTLRWMAEHKLHVPLLIVTTDIITGPRWVRSVSMNSE